MGFFQAEIDTQQRAADMLELQTWTRFLELNVGEFNREKGMRRIHALLRKYGMMNEGVRFKDG